MKSITEILNYTQSRLNNWYVNAKNDYNVDGNATIEIVDSHIVIESEENNEHLSFILPIDDRVLEGDYDYIFNIWMECPHNA